MVGVSPAQDASLRAEPNRLTSPISARMTRAVNGLTPGSWVSTLTCGSGRHHQPDPARRAGPRCRHIRALERASALASDSVLLKAQGRQLLGDDMPRFRRGATGSTYPWLQGAAGPSPNMSEPGFRATNKQFRLLPACRPVWPIRCRNAATLGGPLTWMTRSRSPTLADADGSHGGQDPVSDGA